MPAQFPYRRIAIIGVTGTGKSTLAQRLAGRLNLGAIELDALFWEANWTAAPPERFRARVEAAVHAESWIVTGNYHAVRDLVWRRAEALIWLDYPFRIAFRRLWVRTWRRWWTQEELWNGNREQLGKQLKVWSDESLFHWLFTSYRRHRREFPMLLGRAEYTHLKIFRFRFPVETDGWLETLRQ